MSEKPQKDDFKEKKRTKRKERKRDLFQRQLLHRLMFPTQQYWVRMKLEWSHLKIHIPT